LSGQFRICPKKKRSLQTKKMIKREEEKGEYKPKILYKNMAKTSLNKLNTTKTQPKKDDRACDTECV
jgi:hypothetical protein